jgi:hypothetical protein
MEFLVHLLLVTSDEGLPIGLAGGPILKIEAAIDIDLPHTNVLKTALALPGRLPLARFGLLRGKAGAGAEEQQEAY